jgi:hypothetical protein
MVATISGAGTANRPRLELITCLSDAEWARLTEDRELQAARARSMANHPAFRMGTHRRPGSPATATARPHTLHAVER